MKREKIIIREGVILEKIFFLILLIMEKNMINR